ncbi:transposase [Nonomuraea sp. NPDC052116]|uniref:transposase n=1 Tax=Nonomuraea sp. NPDC052116 TaxID=3155665 RepID=UPI00341F3B32
MALTNVIGRRNGEGDSPYFRRVLEGVRIQRRGLGRPRKRPARVLADKAYSSRANRAYLRRRGIQAVIPIKKDQRANRLKQGRDSNLAARSGHMIMRTAHRRVNRSERSAQWQYRSHGSGEEGNKDHRRRWRELSLGCRPR